ncbi:hypothetical protein [Phytoactinopolyspora halotolerans]|uniref:hypothetical protein n=1 Tax=Phytoactinopolyspora halotolerans TaxID=1981512 RepID=UPI00406BCE8D
MGHDRLSEEVRTFRPDRVASCRPERGKAGSQHGADSEGDPPISSAVFESVDEDAQHAV